jgi:hypothetical protein
MPNLLIPLPAYAVTMVYATDVVRGGLVNVSQEEIHITTDRILQAIPGNATAQQYICSQNNSVIPTDIVGSCKILNDPRSSEEARVQAGRDYKVSQAPFIITLSP